MCMGTGLSRDLYRFDPLSLEWWSLSDQLAGAGPSPRSALGLAAYGAKILIFAGWKTNAGGPPGDCNDLYGFEVPQDVALSGALGAEAFIALYDWDSLILKENCTLTISVDLCTLIFPCTLSVMGAGNVSLHFSTNVSINCLLSNGCSNVFLDSLILVAQNGDDDVNTSISSLPALKVEGANATVVNCYFSKFSSSLDGGTIQAYMGAAVVIERSNFSHSRSEGLGGAISAVGASISISQTMFINCTSLEDGGAVSGTQWQSYASDQIYQSVVAISACVFIECVSQETGGAIFASSLGTNLQISDSMFYSCFGAKAGGAVSAVDFSYTEVSSSVFNGNSALLLGGGALYVQNASMSLIALKCTNNTALTGGGGVLLWDGENEPNILPTCAAGWYPNPADCHQTECSNMLCLPCMAGKYQTGTGMSSSHDCLPCNAGWFSDRIGASTAGMCKTCAPGAFSLEGSTCCTDCAVGKYSDTGICFSCSPGRYGSSQGLSICSYCMGGSYSTEFGANSSESCMECFSGTFADQSGATACMLCTPGSFANTSGSSACTGCSFGKYSMIAGANTSSACHDCRPGSYSSGSATAICLRCLPGTYAEFFGQSSCAACSPGKYIGYNESACYPEVACNESYGVFSETCKMTCSTGNLSRIAYENSEKMAWKISPPNALAIALSFTAFETETAHDILVVYSCPDQSCSTGAAALGSFSGNQIPDTLFSDSGTMLLMWASDYDVTWSGWSARWNALLAGGTACMDCKSEQYSRTNVETLCEGCSGGGFSKDVRATACSNVDVLSNQRSKMNLADNNEDYPVMSTIKGELPSHFVNLSSEVITKMLRPAYTEPCEDLHTQFQKLNLIF